MLPRTKLFPFKIAAALPFEQLSGIFYHYSKGEHMLMVEAIDVDAADAILQKRGIWAFYDDTTDGQLKAGVSRTIEMQRESAKRYGLNIWDDGHIDPPYDTIEEN